MESGRGGPGPGRYTSRPRGRHRRSRGSHITHRHTQGWHVTRTGGGRWLTASLPGHSEALTLPYAVGDKKAGHLTHVHNSKCTCGHARAHTRLHTVSHTWQRCPTAHSGTPITCSHVVGRASHRPSHRRARSPPTGTHTQLHAPEVSHKHPQARPSTRRHARAHTDHLAPGWQTHLRNPHRCRPRTVELYTSHLPRRTHSTHAPSHTKTDVPTCSNFRAKAPRSGTCQPTVTRRDGLTKSRTQVHGHKVLV